MKIRRVRIANFRKLLGPVTLDGLGDGLTVVAGDNEEGKSTVLAAIQTALFDRHRLGGEAAEAMQPFGSAVRPEIEIDFELDGERYRLRKAFCQRPEAELSTPTGRFGGDAAEDRLRELLRFAPPGKGAAKPDHRGVWGLFWVEQGTSFARPRLGASGRETLTEALESEVGQVLGGERGRALKAAVRSEFETFFTARAGRPTGAYKQGLERVQALETEVAELGSRLRDYDDRIDALARVRARLQTYERDRSLEIADRALAAARENRRRIEALTGALAEAETGEKLAEAERRTAEQALATREQRIRAATTASRDLDAGRADADDKHGGVAEAEAERHREETAFAAAKQDVGRAEAILDACERNLQRARLGREAAALVERLERARTSKREGDVRRAEAAAIRIDDAALDALRTLETSGDLARVRLQSAATRIRVFPDAGRKALRDGDIVAPDRPLLVSEQVRLSLEGFGDVEVTPGGEDLSRRRREAERAAEDLGAALSRLGVADTAAAQALLARRTTLLNEAGRHDAALKAHAPEGIATLEQETERRRRELLELAQGATEPAPPIEDAEKHRQAARATFDAAKGARDRIEAALRAVEKRHAEKREAWIAAQAAAEAAERRARQLATDLAAERSERSDDDLRAEATAAVGRHDEAKRIAGRCRRDLDSANPEEVRLRLERAEQAVAAIKADIDRLSGQAIVLETELRTLGQTGLGERLQQAEGELAHARAAAARSGRRAAALRLLLETLTAAERDAKETFLGPVRDRIKPYLRLLFSDAELVLDDGDMAITHLRRGGVDEPFESLSVGTREQLAVLTRLAFADFLRDKGRPAAIILDDALAYADDQRFDRMQLVLRKAAERLQVIVLTCRERDYHALGAPIIRLADCGAGGPGAGPGVGGREVSGAPGAIECSRPSSP